MRLYKGYIRGYIGYKDEGSLLEFPPIVPSLRGYWGFALGPKPSTLKEVSGAMGAKVSGCTGL